MSATNKNRHETRDSRFEPCRLKSRVSCLVSRVQGFTLIEVMVSVGILGFIMTLVWSGSSQSMRAKKRVETREQIYHEATIALRKISDDIGMAFLSKQTKSEKAATPAAGAQGTTPEGTTPPAGAPAAEDKTQEKPQVSPLKTFFIGEDRGDKDKLKFTSLSHLRLFKNAKESDQCKLEYEVVPSSEEGGGFDLVRREDPWLDDSIEVKGAPKILASKVQNFEVEYYDEKKEEWRKEWDTEKTESAGKLPVAARIKISFSDPADEKYNIEMTTAILIALSKGPVEY